MVHDPRVTQQLSRLGGLYRDPARVDRDASSLLKSSVGSHLQPIRAEYVENSGRSYAVLVLQGTIAIHFKGNTYQLLTDMYLPAGYPRMPPVCFVRLADNMYLKQGHRHVGSDGKVYLPYLHEWNPTTHNLVELVVAMSSVFSADPPVFSRTPTATTVTGAAAAAAAAAANATTTSGTAVFPGNPTGFTQSIGGSSSYGTTPMASSTVTATATATGSNTLSHHTPATTKYGTTNTATITAAAAAMDALGREADDANRAVEVARRAMIKEQEEEIAAIAAQRQWETKRLQQVRQQVVMAIRQQCQTESGSAQQALQQDLRDGEHLQRIRQDIIEKQLEQYHHQAKELQRMCDVVDERRQAIENWLEQANALNKKQDEVEHDDDSNHINDAVKAGDGVIHTKKKTISVDDIVQPATPLHGQMLDLAAENAAIADALYFLDRGLYRGQLDCVAHQRHVRLLAKRQFLVRAHLIKIQQILADQHTSSTAELMSY